MNACVVRRASAIPGIFILFCFNKGIQTISVNGKHPASKSARCVARFSLREASPCHVLGIRITSFVFESAGPYISSFSSISVVLGSSQLRQLEVVSFNSNSL